MIGGLDHLRQRLGDLTFGVVDVLKLVDEQIVQRLELLSHTECLPRKRLMRQVAALRAAGAGPQLTRGGAGRLCGWSPPRGRGSQASDADFWALHLEFWR